MLEKPLLNHIRNILTLRYDPEERGPIQHKTWMDWNPTQSDPLGKRTEEILNFVITNQLMDYDKIGISLSSGVDSSLLLAMIREAFPDKKIIAFHYTGVNNDELAGAEKLAMQYEAELKILKPSPVIERIPFMISMMESPKWDCYDYVIPQAAKKENCDILVTGDGSDELYAGYTFRYEKYEKITNYRGEGYDWLYQLFWNYLECHNHDFVADQTELLVDFDWDINIQPLLWTNFSNPLDPLQKVLLADFNGKLCHNFAIKIDKFSKQFDIPIFSPFLTPDIKNYSTHIPLKEKYHNGVGKLPLRAICKRLGLNPPIKKLGFTHNIKEEWKQYKEKYLHPIVSYEIDNPLIYDYGIINPDWVMKNMNSVEERVINKLVSLYTLEMYLQNHVSQT